MIYTNKATPDVVLDVTLRSPRALRYPEYVRRQYGGRSRNFRASHRTALQHAIRALKLCRHGSAYSGDAELIDAAQRLIEKCVEHCRVVNWEGGK